jgi:hypothetical protein
MQKDQHNSQDEKKKLRRAQAIEKMEDQQKHTSKSVKVPAARKEYRNCTFFPIFFPKSHFPIFWYFLFCSLSFSGSKKKMKYKTKENITIVTASFKTLE